MMEPPQYLESKVVGAAEVLHLMRPPHRGSAPLEIAGTGVELIPEGVVNESEGVIEEVDVVIETLEKLPNEDMELASEGNWDEVESELASEETEGVIGEVVVRLQAGIG